MKKCWAFYPIAGTRTAWIPCMRKAEKGARYCRRHGDAIAGVALGAIVHGDDEDLKIGLRRKTKQAARKSVNPDTDLKSPVDDPLAGNLRAAGGSERARVAPAPGYAR